MTKLTIPLGELEGIQNNCHQAWLGIPFAKPPIGDLRFCPPRPVESWVATRPATDYGNSCPQGTHLIPGMAASGPRDEDCLYLNVFTPKADNGNRPVLFWIHGGGFTLGSGSELLYHGGHLAERGDVVVVTIHYRLAALGYACFGKESYAWGASANNGQLDQIQALKWVQEYIRYFGGDPDNVTIFGESAGSAAVGTLLAMPDAKGLFHKAVMQSGAARAPGFESASKLGRKLLEVLNVSADDHAAITALPVDDIVKTAIKLAHPAEISFSPAVDERSLPESPSLANNEGFSSDIPLMIGTNRDEWKLFNAVPDRPLMEDKQLLTAVQDLLHIEAQRAGDIIQLFRNGRGKHNLPTENHDIYDGIFSVFRMRAPCARFAIDHSRHQPLTYHYLFCWESPARKGALGACHALEIPFVFGTLDAPTQDRFAGTGPDAETLAENMMDAWINFARKGNPSHKGIGDWPTYNSESRSTMIFDRVCGVEADPFSAERVAIESIIETDTAS
ncbi:MAG: carboxylesterase/lipase family protein [Gammaproteobacteria bacterium]|nr:carboxylesterase/lipase family protein [Gammaproteobacteria bacterium]